jgi:SAM-dependent methyltransferase
MTKPNEDHLALDLLIRGFQVSRTIRLVADLGVADKIAPDAPCTVAELATACGVMPGPLLRALRCLAAFGIFHVDADGTVAHTPRSRLLRTDVPNSLHHGARFWTASGSWRAWEKLDAALDGKSPHEAAWGTNRFAYLRDHPEEARLFDAFMASFPDDRHDAVARAYDFSQTRLIVDVGGGNGETLRRILARFPEARGIIFDREDVVAAVPSEALADGRITAQGGSFFDGVPSRADLYMFVRVLHNWADENVLRILRTCRAAVEPHGRLLIVDHVLDPDPSRGRPTEYLIDMQMLAMFGSARERTEADFRDVLASAGFGLRRVIPTCSPVSILEATPV